MGKCLLTCPKRFSSFNWDRSCSTRDKYVPVTPAKVPIAPMGNSRFARCLQGGGVYVSSGTVTITSSSIYGNTAYYVCAHLQKFPSTQGECLADMQFDFRRSIGIKSFSTRDGYVPALPANPHRPMGNSRFARCLQGGGVYVSYSGTVTITSSSIYGNTAYHVCAHLQKFPSPRWGFNMFCACAFRAAVFTSVVAR